MSPVFTIRYVFISAAVALLAVVSISAMPQTPARQTFLAIVRADGGLVPIAIHDGREWWNRWPWAIEGDPEVTALPVPARLDAIPPEWLPPGVRLPATWRWQPKDRPARAIRVLHPFRTTASDLMSTILLRTDLPGPSADREERNAFEPLGVAIDAGVDVVADSPVVGSPAGDTRERCAGYVAERTSTERAERGSVPDTNVPSSGRGASITLQADHDRAAGERTPPPLP
jgi:hypothetical protein